MEIRTNNVPRNTIYGCDLTPKQRKEFDYIKEEDLDTHEFVIYKGSVYDVSEFMRIDKLRVGESTPSGLGEWDGYQSQGFFFGVLIKFNDDDLCDDRVIMGEYFS